MSEARQREAWGHTANLMTLMANINRDPKKGRPFRPRDFDPFAPKLKPQVMSMRDLAASGMLSPILPVVPNDEPRTVGVGAEVTSNAPAPPAGRPALIGGGNVSAREELLSRWKAEHSEY